MAGEGQAMDEQLAVIRRAYDQDPEREWARLETGAQNRLEYLVTRAALLRHLPPPDPPCRILDAGGGPGRYTLWLAQAGYRVTLLDLSPGLLDLARRRLAEATDEVRGNVEAVVEASFTDLAPIPDGAFDAVLCLGAAFSHLVDLGARARALGELRRVARPGAPLVLSALSYLGAFRAVVQWWPDEQTIQIFHRLRRGPVLDIGQPAAPARFYLPDELVETLRAATLGVEQVYGVEGLGAHLQEERLLAMMDDPVVWPAWEEVLLATANQPSIVGVARSLLVVARR
jgi:SAM-dependent methyltransferase